MKSIFFSVVVSALCAQLGAMQQPVSLPLDHYLSDFKDLKVWVAQKVKHVDSATSRDYCVVLLSNFLDRYTCTAQDSDWLAMVDEAVAVLKHAKHVDSAFSIALETKNFALAYIAIKASVYVDVKRLDHSVLKTFPGYAHLRALALQRPLLPEKPGDTCVLL